jgi:Spy/CpxP family protein refolding chaperone
MSLCNWIALGIVCVAGAGLAPDARACSDRHGSHHRGHHGPGAMIEWQAEELGLDEPTREAVRKIVESSRERGEALHEEKRAARDALHELLEQDAPDHAEVMRQAELVGALELELDKHRLGTLLEIRALLTPEQRKRMSEMRKDFHERGRGGKWGFHGEKGACSEGTKGACHADSERLCADVPHGPPHWFCLREHASELSDACREALAEDAPPAEE